MHNCKCSGHGSALPFDEGNCSSDDYDRANGSSYLNDYIQAPLSQQQWLNKKKSQDSSFLISFTVVQAVI